MDIKSVLSVDDIACQRGGRRLFQSVSFQLTAGQALQVVGDNGAGKSSLLRLLAGLGRPVDGEITRHAAVRYLGHDNGLKRGLTVRANFEYWAALHLSALDENSMSLLGVESLLEQPVRFLSQGQQRRVALARAMDGNIPLWILDEPTAGLDASVAQNVAEVMKAHRARGGAIVVATHGDIGLERPMVLELRA
jgi:heme exporter protein A